MGTEDIPEVCCGFKKKKNKLTTLLILDRVSHQRATAWPPHLGLDGLTLACLIGIFEATGAGILWETRCMVAHRGSRERLLPAEGCFLREAFPKWPTLWGPPFICRCGILPVFRAALTAG